jgi:predicted RNA-binding Zn-ribbon protein involved in translation (DUF1610 family)
MPVFEIYNQTSGHSLGHFTADDADGALEVMANQAGYASLDDMRLEIGGAELVAVEVSACADCGQLGEARECYACGHVAVVVDCGHYPQPPVISAGRVDGSDPDNWYCEDCGTSTARAEAIDAIGDADDAETRWEAVSHACLLHDVPLLASDPFVQVAAAARDRGHADLADALIDAHCAQARDDRDEGADLGPRVCYGCGRAIDPHAGLSVVWCGSCGDK